MKIVNVVPVVEDCDGPRLWATFAIGGFKLIERSDGDFFVVAPPGVPLPQSHRTRICEAAVRALGDVVA
ncbi:MAG: hypothetical protein WBB98_12105 [Xanthobacteraceae bacterium]